VRFSSLTMIEDGFVVCASATAGKTALFASEWPRESAALILSAGVIFNKVGGRQARARHTPNLSSNLRWLG
jgi:hypothetical protein